MSLKDYIDNKPEILGKPIIDKFGNQLPFLFKVLSVNQALSIQIHPNKVINLIWKLTIIVKKNDKYLVIHDDNILLVFVKRAKQSLTKEYCFPQWHCYIQVFCLKTYSYDSYIKWKLMMCTLNITEGVLWIIFLDFELFNNL